jgi:hypothetical protein
MIFKAIKKFYKIKVYIENDNVNVIIKYYYYYNKTIVFNNVIISIY